MCVLCGLPVPLVVRFLGSLEAFVSCSTSAQCSMVIGWREQEGVPLRLTAFQTEKGANDLDHHPGLNLIGTHTTHSFLGILFK